MSYRVLHKTLISLMVLAAILVGIIAWIFYTSPTEPAAIIIIEAPGDQGLKGSKGESGEQGRQGEDGKKGERGKDGKNFWGNR